MPKEYTVITVFYENSVMMLKHRLGISRDKWTGFGGGIEEGELPVEGAQRELLEELGLSLPITDFFYHGIVTGAQYDEDSPGVTLHLFSVRLSREPPIPLISLEGPINRFSFDAMPWNDMWEEDRIWFISVLNRMKFKLTTVYSGDKLIRAVWDYAP